MKYFLQALLYGILGLLIGGMSFYILSMRARPDLEAWHTVRLNTEYSASENGRITNLQDYMRLEDNLFQQLEEQICYHSPEQTSRIFNRFRKGSWSDPSRFDINWNKTFELRHETPKAGFLMLHGLSGSPYSMRAISICLNRSGAWVIGLRLPDAYPC